MISQMAMKNYLKDISKREYEIAIYNNAMKLNPMMEDYLQYRQFINLMDLEEYTNGFLRAKRATKKPLDEYYYLFYYEKLDYVVPVAFQSSIALITDFEGNIINDVYYLSHKYRIRDLHICVLPLKDETVIALFVEKNSKRYRKFYRQFNKLDRYKKLEAINYMIFSYSEDVYMSKSLNEEVINNPKLKEIAKMTIFLESSDPIQDALGIAQKEFSFDKMNSIPNILSEEYRLR